MGFLQTSQFLFPAPAVLETGMVNLTVGDHWRVLSNATEVHRLVVSRIPDAIPEKFAGCAPLQAATTLFMIINLTSCHKTPHDESPLRKLQRISVTYTRVPLVRNHRQLFSCATDNLQIIFLSRIFRFFVLFFIDSLYVFLQQTDKCVNVML